MTSLESVHVTDMVYTNAPQDRYAFEAPLLALPWGLFAGAEVLFTLLLGLCFLSDRRYRRAHFSPDAIREAVDRLPAGICITSPDGAVLLSNLRMNALCQELTGEPLTDGERFWREAEERGTPQGEEQTLVLTGEKEAWLFARTQFRLDGRAYRQLIATDMTAQYRVTEALTARNRALREVQYRMKAVAARERSLVAAREAMNARMTVHNQMGNVLLTGKYYLDHPEDMDDAELVRLLEYSGGFLLGEAEQPQAAPDALREALRMARRVGVTVLLRGAAPEGGPARSLLGQAVEQCAANAVRHAGGDRLEVSLTREAGLLRAEITNNGEQPRGPIAETGGLAALRRMVEAAGGGMAVESAPAFRLTLRLPLE